ncbi:programmed cell death protein 2-like [Centropristis striata]|uniref:programmed cell death protein 2-like n=1 Tax=Centropristis striata TaxID=184440 RepID=UPI0027DF045B|nr:programmed cell death protein 2-like [Centropristis striata]
MASTAQDVTLVGLCDGELDSKKHQSSYLTNKLGGHPDWLPTISRQSPRCARCGAPLTHVVQVYCPLQASPYHRNLHLFACPGAECSGRSDCWRVLRSQGLEAAAQTPSRPVAAQEAPLSATDWCDTADDWGMEEEEGDDDDGWGGGVKKGSQVQEEAAAPEAGAPAEMDVSSRLQDLNLGDSQTDVPVLRPFFISVEEELDLVGEENDLRHAQQLLKEYERREGVAVRELEGNEGGGGGEEKYEKMRARHGDAVFSRFMKKISLCPQQILRYCRGGKPLFISEPPSNMGQIVSACGSCGGSRTFELQLMPALVSLLQREDRSAEAELEFGTVLVYTCTNSCWTEGSGSAVEEFCFVQTDPDQQLFK